MRAGRAPRSLSLTKESILAAPSLILSSIISLRCARVLSTTDATEDSGAAIWRPGDTGRCVAPAEVPEPAWHLDVRGIGACRGALQTQVLRIVRGSSIILTGVVGARQRPQVTDSVSLGGVIKHRLCGCGGRAPAASRQARGGGARRGLLSRRSRRACGPGA
jgi:hypothetical protein